MKTIYSFLFLLFFAFPVCQAQSPSMVEKKTFPKHNITLHLTQLMMGEFRIGYEQLLGQRHSLGFELAYRPSYGENNLAFNLLGFTSNQPYLAVDSYTSFFNYRFYLSPSEYPRIRLFLEGKLMGRYIEYHDKMYSRYNPRESTPSHLESGYVHVYGGFLLFGARFYMNESRTFFAEAQAGFSVREAHLHSQVKATCSYAQGTICDQEHLLLVSDDSAPFQNTVELRGAPQMGLKLGVAF